MHAKASKDRASVAAREVSMVPKMYGIQNCDTIKRAKAWLDEQGIAYEFHNFSKQGIEQDQLRAWVEELGWQALLNKAGTTFQSLPDAEKHNVDAEKAIAMMQAKPSMIKRPVLDVGQRRLVGFKPELYDQALTDKG
jgi:arsenate reductase